MSGQCRSSRCRRASLPTQTLPGRPDRRRAAARTTNADHCEAGDEQAGGRVPPHPTRQRFRPPSSRRTPRFPRVRPMTTIAAISGAVTPRVCSTMTSGEPTERLEVGASGVQHGQRHPEQPGDGEGQQQIGGEGVPHDPDSVELLGVVMAPTPESLGRPQLSDHQPKAGA